MGGLGPPGPVPVLFLVPASLLSGSKPRRAGTQRRWGASRGRAGTCLPWLREALVGEVGDRARDGVPGRLRGGVQSLAHPVAGRVEREVAAATAAAGEVRLDEPHGDDEVGVGEVQVPQRLRRREVAEVLREEDLQGIQGPSRRDKPPRRIALAQRRRRRRVLVNGDYVAAAASFAPPPVVVDHGVDDDVGAGLQEAEAARDAGLEAGDELGVLGDREQLEGGLVVPADPLQERLLTEEGAAVVDAQHSTGSPLASRTPA